METHNEQGAALPLARLLFGPQGEQKMLQRERDTSLVVQIVGYLQEAATSVGCSAYEIYSRVLDLWYAVLKEPIEGEAWQESIRGIEGALPCLANALALLLLGAAQSYGDLLGPVAGALRMGDTRFPGIGTPYFLAEMQAAVALDGLVRPRPGEEPRTVYSPACVSGAFLLAAAELIEERCPDMIELVEVAYYGDDLYPLNVAMVRFNCLGRPEGKKDLRLLIERLEGGDPSLQCVLGGVSQREPTGAGTARLCLAIEITKQSECEKEGGDGHES